MLFQQEMRLPIDAEVMRKEEDDEVEGDIVDGDSAVEGDSMEKIIEVLLEKREELFQEVDHNIKTAQQKQKETYERKHLPEELAPGTEVLIENTAQKDRKGGKLEEAFKGPYIIHETLGKGIYKVKNNKGAVLQKKVNINRLKVYKRRNDSKVKQSLLAIDCIIYQLTHL